MTELLLNTGFETAGGGGADVFANWVEQNTVTDETTIVHGGAHSAKLDPWALVRQDGVAIAQTGYYCVSAWVYGTGSPQFQMRVKETDPNGSFQLYSDIISVTNGTWTHWEAYFETTSGTTEVHVELYHYGADGYVYVDDASLSLVESVDTGFSDLGFEEWHGANSPKHWVTGFNPPQGDESLITREDDDVHGGGHALSLGATTTAWCMVGQSFLVSPGIYFISFWVKGDGAAIASYDVYAWGQDAYWEEAYDGNFSDETEWTQHTLLCTVPDDVAEQPCFIELWFDTIQNTEGRCLVDDVRVWHLPEPGSVDGVIVDVAQPDNVVHMKSWDMGPEGTGLAGDHFLMEDGSSRWLMEADGTSHWRLEDVSGYSVVIHSKVPETIVHVVVGPEG